MKTISIQLTDEILTNVDAIAKKWKISRAEMVRQALVSYFETTNRDYLLLQELDIIKRQLVDINNIVGSSVETNINDEV